MPADESTPETLTPDLLLSAYVQGVFPMEMDGEIHWFSPDPRAVFELDRFHVPRSTASVVRQGRFDIGVNRAFGEVIRACAEREEGTWIDEAIVDGYTRLHTLGFAHSVEAYRDGRLVGGLYGVAINGCFFGESMFHRERDASKVALVHLVERLRDRQFELLDIQFVTPHLVRFGAREIPRDQYLRRLALALKADCNFVD